MTAQPFLNLSPGEDRIGRASAWIEREDGCVLMVALNRGGWTLPGRQAEALGQSAGAAMG